MTLISIRAGQEKDDRKVSCLLAASYTMSESATTNLFLKSVFGR